MMFLNKPFQITEDWRWFPYKWSWTSNMKKRNDLGFNCASFHCGRIEQLKLFGLESCVSEFQSWNLSEPCDLEWLNLMSLTQYICIYLHVHTHIYTYIYVYISRDVIFSFWNLKNANHTVYKILEILHKTMHEKFYEWFLQHNKS